MLKRSIRRTELKKERELAGLCVYCGKNSPEKEKQGCKNCLEKKYKIQKNYLEKDGYSRARIYNFSIRKEVVEKYGGKCNCCGEDNIAFLTIDHINEDGSKERRELYGSQNGASKVWFLKLRREEARKDLQVLCYNCNNAKTIFGKCPHEDEKVLPDLSILKVDRRRNEFKEKTNQAEI